MHRLSLVLTLTCCIGNAVFMAYGPAVQVLAYHSIVVALEPPGPRSGTFEIFASADLLAVSGSTDVTEPEVTITAPLDALTINVPMTYARGTHTVSITTSQPYATVSAGTRPVVLHKPWFAAWPAPHEEP